jgi:CBS domain-containing protein
MNRVDLVRAEDLMQVEVITLPVGAPISEAVQTFEECGIKGAPVVDAAGNAVGVITASDIARTSHLQGDRITERRGDYYLVDAADELGADGSRRSEEFLGKHEFSPEVTGVETIGDWMTSHVVSVAPEATIGDVCRTMSNEGIHRVMVVRRSRILGVISSLDIVRHIAKEE